MRRRFNSTQALYHNPRVTSVLRSPMASRPPDPSALWDAATPLGGLLALERRWLASRRIGVVSGAKVWIAPIPVEAAAGDCIGLVLAGAGRLTGPMCARADALPFADGSVRLLVLQHALDRPFEAAVYGECVRVLATGAELVVFGLNPLSAWRPWVAWRARRNGARPRARMASRVGALFGQLGLATQSLTWIGPHRPGSIMVDDASVSPRAMFRAAYALSMRKPHDSVIRLRPRSADREVDFGPGFVPNATPRVGTGP